MIEYLEHAGHTCCKKSFGWSQPLKLFAWAWTFYYHIIFYSLQRSCRGQ